MEELPDFASFFTSRDDRMNEYLGNNVIIVKGRLYLGTSPMHTSTQRTEKSLYKLVGVRVQISPFFRDQFSLHTFSPWILSPPTIPHRSSYFCLSLFFFFFHLSPLPQTPSLFSPFLPHLFPLRYHTLPVPSTTGIWNQYRTARYLCFLRKS